MITSSFVRNVRKEALNNGATVESDHLLTVLRRIQAGDYNGAISYAKEHGFDLETMKYNANSGVLASTWTRMMDTMKVWGTRPQFISMDKTMSIASDVVGAVARKKYDVDTPYRR